EVDSLKVGIGPGTTCTTRIVTGCGVPQLTAIMECAKIAKDYDIPLVADGGIKVSGDITKALAAGASTVMIGGSFAGTQEAPGVTRIINGMKYKVCRGMASFDATQDRLKKTEENKNNCNPKTSDDIVPEGIEALVPFRGNVSELIKQFIGGLKSGISYCGANNIKSMQENATFIKITAAGMTESKPHDVKVSY
ncbi:IMP dehydrogenase, partial [Candidatus Woesearchaeota archaeon]|nr:IMP dehydrogenase [Candidatus Woesearchaeota archaeon]